MNKLHVLYKNILDFAGFIVEDDGEMKVSLNGREFPADIDGKLMKFPCDEALKAFKPEKEIIFHPLQEFINRGESEVVRKLRRIINVRLNLSTLSMLDGLMEILSTPALHAKMNPQQRELIRSVDVIDDVLRGKFMAAATVAFTESPDALFVNLYTKKSGTFKGDKHARVGVVSFPVMSDVPPAFQKLKEKDWKKVLQLLEFIFPGQDDAEAYNSFSDSTDCPWLDCLLRTSINVAGRLNELWDLYGKFVDNENVIMFNMDWVNGFDNLDSYKKEIMMIPSQRGNEGEVEQAAVKPTGPTISPSALSAAPVPTQARPVEMVPVPVERRHAQPPQQPIYGDAVQPAAPLAPAPVKVNTNGKVSFDSLAQSNPALLPPVPFNSPITMQQQQQQMLAYQAAMMNSPSMAAMAGAMPGMMPPQQGFMNPWGQPPQMMPQMQYDQFGRPVMPTQMQYDQYGRPIMGNMIQGV